MEGRWLLFWVGNDLAPHRFLKNQKRDPRRPTAATAPIAAPIIVVWPEDDTGGEKAGLGGAATTMAVTLALNMEGLTPTTVPISPSIDVRRAD
jgi:hypothetical protein